MSTLHEKFTSWYLRFNGYFTIDNFIVHAGGDENRIRDGIVAPYTEIDSLAIRMPYSSELTGNLEIVNHNLLVENKNEKIDVIIAEVKSGNTNTPNPVWRNKNAVPISYIVRFIGLFSQQEMIDKATTEIINHYSYEDENFRIRYIVFANEPNRHYSNQGVTYITFFQMVQFLVEVRGQCWVDSSIGVKSIHNQWDELINKALEIANDFKKSSEERQSTILRLLAAESEKPG